MQNAVHLVKCSVTATVTVPMEFQQITLIVDVKLRPSANHVLAPVIPPLIGMNGDHVTAMLTLLIDLASVPVTLEIAMIPYQWRKL